MAKKRGKVARTHGMARLEGNIADSEDSYRYLGIPQTNDNYKEDATHKYPQESGEWKEQDPAN